MRRRRRNTVTDDVPVPDWVWLDALAPRTGDEPFFNSGSPAWEWLAGHGLDLLMALVIRCWHKRDGAARVDGPEKCPCPAHRNVRGAAAVVEYVNRTWLGPGRRF